MHAHFAPVTGSNRGLPVNEAALIATGATPDTEDGSPGSPGERPPASEDVNDVVGSQGTRGGSFLGVTEGRREDAASLLESDPPFDASTPPFTAATQVPQTFRRTTGRNSPSVLNAVYNLRNFWDGRANMYFNGVNPLGVNDPGAVVRVFLGASGLADERLDIPFSSLASQAVGPIGSDVEMTLGTRPLRDLGKKLAGAAPLAGQTVAEDDSLLASLRDPSGRGLSGSYAAMIRQIFNERFWGDGTQGDVCVDAAGVAEARDAAGACPSYTLIQYNFPLFFGLAVQAYEATLRTDQTIVDLIAGGIATGTLVNGRRTVDVTGMALDGCIQALGVNNSPAQVDVATSLCTAHYAKFIHPLASSGSESHLAPNPIPAESPIGGCVDPTTCLASPNEANGQATLLNVNRGLGRFFAGATACSVCHFNPEFTGATVSAITRFGAKLPALPAGQLRKELEARAIVERMNTFNGAPAVYDAGFYNLGVRPTFEDLSLGNSLNDVPLSIAKAWNEVIAGTASETNGAAIGNLLSLTVPTQPDDLTPIPFPLTVGCGAGVLGNGNGNNNPAAQCVPTVIAGERLLRHGAFKAPGLRNVKYTGPYFHNGSKMTLRQVLEFYKGASHMLSLNLNNLDAGLRVFELNPEDESAVVELLETGLTDFRVAFRSAPFDNPEICVPNGHDPVTGLTQLAGVPAVGGAGSSKPLATFVEMLGPTGADDASLDFTMKDRCTVTFDVPPK